MEPVGGVAIASEGRRTYVMLRRRGGETLDQLMTRLDHAIAKVVLEGTFTDEINVTK
jgi:molybdopterin-guanine dinucleotide biosynthesis protein